VISTSLAFQEPSQPQTHLDQAQVILLYFNLPNIINPIYTQQLTEMVPPPSQNTVGVSNQITLIILYYT